MYASQLLTGAGLPPGTLCLTYDDGPGATVGDGPGPQTLPLARYLADEGVSAAFFMTGRHVALLPDAPEQVRALGHVVGNHTFAHPDLCRLVDERGTDAVVDEIATTDPLIAPGVDGAVYVRPPYGSWSAAVADGLNAAPSVSGRHVGPVGWDIDTDDWALWRDRTPPEQAAAILLAAVEAAGRGIVLMHDSTADHVEYQDGNAAYPTTRLLVPELRRRGFTFVGLDAVPLA